MKWYYWLMIAVGVIGLAFLGFKMFGKNGWAKKNKVAENKGAETPAETPAEEPVKEPLETPAEEPVETLLKKVV